jgi:hypothetical protein
VGDAEGACVATVGVPVTTVGESVGGATGGGDVGGGVTGAAVVAVTVGVIVGDCKTVGLDVILCVCVTVGWFVVVVAAAEGCVVPEAGLLVMGLATGVLVAGFPDAVGATGAEGKGVESDGATGVADEGVAGAVVAGEALTGPATGTVVDG